MNDERSSLSSSFIVHRSSFAYRFLHHLLVDRDDAAAFGGIELQAADDAAEGLAQGARAEAFLARGFPGDGDERAAGDLEIDAEAREVIARRPEDRAFRLVKDAREIAFAEVVQHHDRLETRDELRRHPVAKEIIVFDVVAKMERQ